MKMQRLSEVCADQIKEMQASNKSLQQIIQLLTLKIQADEITQKEPKYFTGVEEPVELF